MIATREEIVLQAIMRIISNSSRFYPLRPPERFNDGEVTIYIKTPMSIEEYRRFGLELAHFLLEQGITGQVNNETTGETIPVE